MDDMKKKNRVIISIVVPVLGLFILFFEFILKYAFKMYDTIYFVPYFFLVVMLLYGTFDLIFYELHKSKEDVLFLFMLILFELLTFVIVIVAYKIRLT